MLYLPGQSLDRFQLDWLGRFFGPPFLHPLVNNGYPDCPAVLELLRKPEDTIGFGGEGWDADVTWMNPVGYVSILHGLEIPAVGGDTGFASTHAAYDALSPGMQKLLDGMEAVHSYAPAPEVASHIGSRLTAWRRSILAIGTCAGKTRKGPSRTRSCAPIR